jgi:ribose transport system ATP-binding protein
MEKLLQMINISKSYSRLPVLKNVSFDLFPGEIHVLLGENGAGKSTLIKILSGAEQKSAGKILIKGKEVAIKNPRDGFKSDIRVIYQELNLNENLSIAENVFLGKEKRAAGYFVDWKETIRATGEIIKQVGLEADPMTLVSELSIAQKQMVELSKALVCKASILVLDEPTAALTENEKNTLFNIIFKLKNEGMGIIYISHRLNEMFEIGDRVTVLRNGELVKTLPVGDVTYDEIIQLIVGKNIASGKKSNPRKGGETILDVKHIGDGERLKDVSFTLKKGVVLGVAGLVGSGRTELAKCIIGANKRKTGEVIYKGKLARFKNPGDSAEQGIVYLSEDRKKEGLIMQHSVRDNALLPSLGKMLDGCFLNKKRENSTVSEMIKHFAIKAPSQNTEIRYLSGGNQQKVCLAKWIEHGADIYIIDEPTRGIDPGAREQIYDIINALVDRSVAVIVISSDIVELLKLADGVLVLKDGKNVALFENNESLTQTTVLRNAIGVEQESMEVKHGIAS